MICRLLVLRGSISPRSKVGCGSAGTREKSREDWLKDRSEDNLSTIGHRKSHPEDKNELEDVVECCHILVSEVQYWKGDAYGTSKRH